MAEVQALETKVKDNMQQIENCKNDIAKAQQQHVAEVKEKKIPIEEQLSVARQSLDGLQKQKEEYLQQFPQWICLIGEDAEV